MQGRLPEELVATWWAALLATSPLEEFRQDCVSERMGEPGFDGLGAFR